MFGGGNTPNAKIPGEHGWDEETGPGEGETWAEWWDGLSWTEQALIITLIAAGVIAAGWLIYEWWNNGGRDHANDTDCPMGDCGPVDPGGGGNVPVIPDPNTPEVPEVPGEGNPQVWDNEDPTLPGYKA
jgi:hypothetical protein